MKNVIIMLAIAGLSACATSNRNPSADGGSSAQISKDSLAAMESVSQVSIGFAQSTSDAILSGAALASKASQKSFDFSENMVVSGIGFVSEEAGESKRAVSKSATFVFEKSKSASQESSALVSRGAHFVVTTSGQIIDSTVTSTKSAVGVSVKVSKAGYESSKSAVIEVWNRSETILIGTLTVSENVASRVADLVGQGIEFVMDSSGRLIQAGADSTSAVVGFVWDQLGRSVGFVVDASGKIFTVSKDKSIIILTGSSKAMGALASGVWSSMKTTGVASVDVVKASAKGSVAILKGSGQSIMIVSDSIKSLFHSEKYDSPVAPAPAPTPKIK